ncbi:MAG: tRNA (adenosine(37)-N6)-dimethylallyltransferase MiaA [Treponema sp.]|nr:tRNA (adenosine(37)-N6)-dimethylallyltransferase MiaA [Treponema sp.]
MKQNVIVIFAPTASGKTALTKELFSLSGSHFILNAEIISADSQAVYNGMDIGTAKPASDFCKLIPHHLINLVNPDQQFNVADFVDLADKACLEIASRGKTPVICGGTGFYIRNFLFGLPKTPESSPQVREMVSQKLKNEGKEALYAQLSIIDPQSAKKIHPNDQYRICRALEVFYSSGQTRSSFELNQNLRDLYNFLFIVLEPPKDLLKKRIYDRVDLMFQQGLEEEVKSLISSGYDQNCPGMKAIGYAEFFKYKNREEIISAIKSNSYKYAKKQFTYIRDIKGSKIIPFTASPQDIQKVAALIKESDLFNCQN